MIKTWMLLCAVAVLCGCDKNPPNATESAQSAAAIATPAAGIDGAAIYRQHCAACHDSGLEGAPAIDDVPAWAERAPEWAAVLTQHATEGFLNMPARGASPQLADAEVAAAVEHMRAELKPPALLKSGGAQGRLVYQASCSECHDGSRDDAPAIGDPAAWAVRSANWHTVLEQHANEGFLGMPAKGAELQLFREDVAAAVEFMVAWSRRQ